MDTFDSWLQLALGGSRKGVNQPGAEYDQSGTYASQPLNDSLDQALEPSHGRESDGNSKVRAENEGERERDVERPPMGSNAHYYFRLSSTPEKPNRFLDRSLPFFVPPASSR